MAELFTGKPIFPGEAVADQLALKMEVDFVVVMILVNVAMRVKFIN